MIAFTLLLFFVGCGCEEKAVTTDENMQNNAVKSAFNSEKETTYGLLTKCDENCSETGWCTVAEKSSCKTTGNVTFKVMGYTIKRPGGKPTVCSDISSCAPSNPNTFIVKLESLYPDDVSIKIVTENGDIFARSYIEAYEEETGSAFLKFEVQNEKLRNEFLLIKGETVVLNNEGEKIKVEIVGELGSLDW